jgi:uncharacterized protein (DUF1330 family)
MSIDFVCWREEKNHRLRLSERLTMSAFVVFDVDIRDPDWYRDFMSEVKPALIAAGARYPARGGAHKVYEGDWQPRRIVILEFPSTAAWEAFYEGPVYQGLEAIRDECSSAPLVSVEGLSNQVDPVTR